MTKKYIFTVEVSDTEHENFLHRISGADGRKVTLQTDADDEGPTNTAAPETDKNGVAWDARFHASSKAIVADGSWRRKKGLTDAEKAAADEYDASGNAAPVETPSVPAEPVAPMPSAEPAPLPGLPTMPGLPAAAPAPEPVSYEDLVKMFQTLKPEVAANFGALYAEAGVTDPNALKTDGDLRIALAGVIKAHNS